ncbi:MAG: hypothetical protein J6R46_06165 [Clostridia bacterium]|nr:hypothetical protein [Clostridia bacterium]
MTKAKLDAAVQEAKAETRNALQTVYDALNHGQKQKLLKDAAVAELMDRYGVVT